MTTYLEMACPHCQRPLKVRASYAGHRVCCRYCDDTFVVRSPESRVLPSESGPSVSVSNGDSIWDDAGASGVGRVGLASDSSIGSGGSSPGMSHVGPVPGRRIGEYELLDQLSRSAMSFVCRARHLPTGRIVTLQVEAKVLAEGPSSLILRPDAGDLPGWRIPGYEFLQKLCDGSMGRVYLARQVSVDRKVAIKVLRESRARNKEYIERYRREARLAARLSHPNVVTTLDAGEADGHHYIVMEYIEGETVQEILNDGYVFEEDEAIEVVLRVSEALKHVHEMGLIHRDVKPANVMLRPDGLVKLIDLGLARSIDDEDWMASEAGMAVGTPEFISPEQVRGQTDVDIRADIYSLGATLYAMVTGTVPHPGTNPREVMHKHVDRHAVPIPPDQHNDRLSDAMVAIITRMMARNRDERFPYLDQVIASLDQVKATNGCEDGSVSADP